MGLNLARPCSESIGRFRTGPFLDRTAEMHRYCRQEAGRSEPRRPFPRIGLHFCDEIRGKRGYFDLPDDIILQAIIRRKNPGAF
jgi:hypothetical protein